MRWFALILPALVAASVPDAPRLAPVPSKKIVRLVRSLDVAGTVTRETAVVSFDQAGGQGDWYLPVEFERAKTVSLIEVTEGKAKSNNASPFLIHSPRVDTVSGVNFYRVDIPSTVSVVTITYHYTHWTIPLPDRLNQEQGDKQGMLWFGDLLGGFGSWNGSLANDVEVIVKVKAPTPMIFGYRSSDGFSATQTSGSATVVFTNRGIQFASQEIAHVHYHQPIPVASISNFTRLVEVSHWGANLAIEDSITVVNQGPKLRSQVFSRYAHQTGLYTRKPGYLSHTLTSLTIPLPHGAINPYYVDTIGNVTTSHFRPGSSGLSKLKSTPNPPTLEIIPRYPILGGWQYAFRFGFDLPSQKFLKKSENGEYIVSVSMFSPLWDVAMDNVTLRVRLPEGAENIKVITPFPVDQLETSLIDKTFLDTTGRPTVLIRKAHCTERHSLALYITYTRSTISALQKPGAVAGWMLALFLGGGLLRRFEWKI